MDKFDQLKNYIKSETDRLNLKPYISEKNDFYGIKTDKKDRYFLLFISYNQGILTLTYREDYRLYEVNRVSITDVSIEDVGKMISEIISSHIDAFSDNHSENQVENDGFLNNKKKRQKRTVNIASITPQECVSIGKIPDSCKNINLVDLPCDISIRLLNCLHRASIYTVGDFLKLNNSDLSCIRNLGKNALREAIILRQMLMYEENMKIYNAYSKDHKKADDSIIKKLTFFEMRDITPLINMEHYNFDYTEQDLVRYTEFNGNIKSMLIEHLSQINKSYCHDRNNGIFIMRIG